MGILFYDKEGKLIAVNPSAHDIMGIPESEDINLNLFNNPAIASQKEKLIREGIIKVRSEMNFEDIQKAGYYNPTRSGIVHLDFIISFVDSGYLVQIRDRNEDSGNSFKSLDLCISEPLDFESFLQLQSKPNKTPYLRAPELKTLTACKSKLSKVLKKSELYYKTIFENTGTAFIIFEEDTTIFLVNTEAEKILGYSNSELEGKRKWVDFIIKKEDLLRMEECHRLRMKTNDTSPEKYELQIVDKQGNVKDIITTVSMIPETKKCIASFLNITKLKKTEFELQKAHDNLELKVKKRTSELKNSNNALRKEIEDRKQAEEALIKSKNYLDKIINSIADPVFAKDKEHRWVLLNDAYCRLIGYSREEILGKSDYDFFPSDEADIFWEKDEEVLQTGIENVNEEDFTDSDGDLHTLVTKKTLYTDISGEKYIVASIKDLTKRKKAENELRRSERKLKLAMDMAKLAYWEYDVSSDMFTFDDRFYKLYGTSVACEGGFQMSPEEYARRFIPREESGVVSEEINNALKTDDHDFFRQVQHTIIMADGEKRFITVRYGVIKNNEGRTIKTYGVNQDITELKHAENALKDNEAKFRGIFDNAIDMISLIKSSKDGNYMRYIEVNKAGINRLGYSKEEILNMSPYDIDEGPETPEYMEKLFKKGHVRFETIHVAKNGTKIPVEVIIHFINHNNMNIALEISRDITERKKAENELKESEQKYRTLFNSSPDSTILIGTDGNLLDVNYAAQEVTGISRKDLIGKNFTELDILLDEEMPLHIKKVSQILGGGNAKPYESRFIDKNGKIHYSETYLKSLKRDDEIFAFNVIAHDITERKKAEEKLKEMICELERSNYELQQFAYVSSHDLQEPLRTIASFTQLLERRYRGQLDDDADEFIEFIVDAAVRMKEMIQGLLEYSRVGTQEVELKEVDMNVELNQALSNLHALISRNNAEIIHDHLPTVRADPDQMVRVFQNLIGNAIKFRKPDVPPEIHISCQTDEENDECVFEVSDNGIGIEKEYKDKIFEVFKRLHAMGKYDGTGIGLSVVKRIIEQYNGRIWVESKFGEGSTFYFTLPAAQKL